MAIEIGKIRNVGVVGHGGVGKTSLVEAMLFTAGAVTRLGRVDDGSTTTDFDPDEIKRKISINTSVAYCDWKGHHINLVDTPGYGDFIADARAGLRVVEAAVVVVDAVAGVQVQTEKVWKFADGVRPAPGRRRQSPRPRALRLLPHLRVAGQEAQGAAGRAPSAHRGGVGLPRLRRSRQDEGGHARRRQARRGRDTRRARRPGQGVPRKARRGRRRDRRRPARQVSRGGLARASRRC